jgi:NADH:ubiquinone oxidoreductase subunit 6 (subunit J)
MKTSTLILMFILCVVINAIGVVIPIDKNYCILSLIALIISSGGVGFFLRQWFYNGLKD